MVAFYITQTQKHKKRGQNVRRNSNRGRSRGAYLGVICRESGQKRIDIGKIMALKRARWTDEDIAAEMRMEPAAVTKIIRQYIKRQLAEGRL